MRDQGDSRHKQEENNYRQGECRVMKKDILWRCRERERRDRQRTERAGTHRDRED